MDQFDDMSNNVERDDSQILETSDTKIDEILAEERATSKPKKDSNELPKDYIQYDIELIVCAMNFSMINEFG